MEIVGLQRPQSTIQLTQESHALRSPARLWVNPRLRDDGAMASPPVSARDRLCHQHVQLVSPLDEELVQQVSVPRPRVHPGAHLLPRKAGEGVGQDAVFCAGSQVEQTIFIGAFETTGTQHFSPGSMFCANAGAEVTKDNQLIRLQHSRQEGV
nr:unnamed protein product [Spirometra erinaceieuropaei]